MCFARGDLAKPTSEHSSSVILLFIFYLNRNGEPGKAFWIMKALVRSWCFSGLRWGPFQTPIVFPQPDSSCWRLSLGFSGGWVPDNAHRLRVWHPHSPLYIPSASVCSKALILDLIQAQRNVCVFSMSGRKLCFWVK